MIFDSTTSGVPQVKILALLQNNIAKQFVYILPVEARHQANAAAFDVPIITDIHVSARLCSCACLNG